MGLDVMGMLLAGAEPPAAGRERHQVLFTPAFHRTALLTVEVAEEAVAVGLRVFADSLWESLVGNVEVRRAGTEAELAVLVALALPAYSDHGVGLGAEAAARLRVELGRALPGLAAPDERCGRDGIGLDVAVATATGPTRRFTAWSPTPDMPAHAYFATMHRVASEIRDEAACVCLAQLHGYLELGPPVRDDGGAPRRLQIFGRLTEVDEPALVRLFAGVGEEEPALVDMRGFEWMIGALLRRFERFSARRGPTVWVTSQAARRQLRAAGVPARQLHHDPADALLHLETLRLGAR